MALGVSGGGHLLPPVGSVVLVTTGYPLLPTARVKLSPTHATKAAVLSTPRRRALKQNKRSRGNEPNLFATGPQECGRMVTTGGSHGDAEPQHPHSRSRHPGVSTMLPLLLLLLPAAHGIGESSHASGMGSGFPSPLRGSPCAQAPRAWRCRAADPHPVLDPTLGVTSSLWCH